jgi:hypothetical protein
MAFVGFSFAVNFLVACHLLFSMVFGKRATMYWSGILTVFAIFPIAYAVVEWALPSR